MKAVIGDFFTNIYPTDTEVVSECKIGKGANTCIFLTMSAGGSWDCVAQDFRKNLFLITRAEAGEMVAQRRGCDRVNTWNSVGMEVGIEVDIP